MMKTRNQLIEDNLDRFLADVRTYGKGTYAVELDYPEGHVSEQQQAEFVTICGMYLDNQIAKGHAPTEAEIYMFSDIEWIDGLLALAAADMLAHRYQYVGLVRAITEEVAKGKRDPRDLTGRLTNSRWAKS